VQFWHAADWAQNWSGRCLLNNFFMSEITEKIIQETAPGPVLGPIGSVPELHAYIETVKAKYNSRLNLNKLQEDIPVIGIPTLPSADYKYTQ
jgi:hypothetical protein